MYGKPRGQPKGATTVSDDTEIIFRDFTKKRKRIVFRIDPDEFECVSALMPDALQSVVTRFRGQDFTEALKSRNIEAVIQGVQDIFTVFLIDEESDARFKARLQNRRNPVDTSQLVEITSWLIEVYTNRPTEPSSDSLDSSQSDDGGAGFPAGAQLGG